MTDAPADRYPRVVQLLGHVRGVDSLPDEVGRYADADVAGPVLDTLEAVHLLLEDATVGEEQLDALARAHTPVWFGSGRSTLEHVGEALMRVMEARAGLRGDDDLDPTPVVPPDDVHRRLSAWLEEQDLFPPEDYEGWAVVDAGEGRWVLTPPGWSGLILVVLPDRIRAIRPAYESVPDAMRELGIQ